MLNVLSLIVACALLLTHPASTNAQSPDPSTFQELRYRTIGPFRASRTVGGVGVPSQPSVFYVGVNNGGLWKSDGYGRTWRPIFDDRPTGSVGDIAVSPSHLDIIYVGTGEGVHCPDLSVGDGVFESTDGGRSWRHVGLDDVQQVGRVVHQEDPDIVFVAGMGHPYGANEERGVFRTTDGGRSWEKVLYRDENTGASTSSSTRPTLPRSTPDYMSTVWAHGRTAGSQVPAPGSTSRRTVARLGSVWKVVCRATTGDQAAGSTVPTTAARTSSKRLPTHASGATCGINPNDPDIMLFTADQGAVVTVNGGRSWSS